MQTPQVHIVSIHDEEPGRCILAVDLKQIMSSLGNLATDWAFCFTALEVMSAEAMPLMQKVDSCPRGVWLSHAEMIDWAARIEQTINGTVLAFPSGIAHEEVQDWELSLSSFPTSRAVCAITAIDSSYFEVYAKESAVTEAIRRYFTRVTTHDAADYFG